MVGHCLTVVPSPLPPFTTNRTKKYVSVDYLFFLLLNVLFAFMSYDAIVTEISEILSHILAEFILGLKERYVVRRSYVHGL